MCCACFPCKHMHSLRGLHMTWGWDRRKTAECRCIRLYLAQRSLIAFNSAWIYLVYVLLHQNIVGLIYITVDLDQAKWAQLSQKFYELMAVFYSNFLMNENDLHAFCHLIYQKASSSHWILSLKNFHIVRWWIVLIYDIDHVSLHRNGQ